MCEPPILKKQASTVKTLLDKCRQVNLAHRSPKQSSILRVTVEPQSKLQCDSLFFSFILKEKEFEKLQTLTANFLATTNF